MNWILIIIGLLLIIVNLKGTYKKIDFKFKDKLKESEENDLKIMELRREFSEKILDLEMEIKDKKTKLNEREDGDIKKAKEVKKLIDENYSVEMISQKLKISREEIILLKDLY